jgi:type IX secretion system PorP/SprF family membrane protein
MKTNLKVFIIAGAILYTGVSVNAQQIPQFTQYILNPFMINPAYAGTTDHYDIKASYRKQWVGIDNSPSTVYLSGHGHVGKEHPRQRGKSRNQNSWHHGIGGIIMNDQTGPLNNIRVNLAYSYDFSLSSEVRMSFGVAGGVKQFSTNLNNVKLNDGTNNVNAPLADLNNLNGITPDLSFGTYIYNKNFFVGLSAQNLIFNNIPGSVYGLDKRVTQKNNYYAQHLFLQGGYVFMVNEMIHIIPSALMKYAINNPNPSFDFNAKVKYNNMIWGGLNYRTSDAFSAYVGILIDKRYEVSYAYDYGLSYISGYSSGSHEIMIGYRIQPKYEIKSPSDYW